jgi:hypothetical protein
MVIRKTSGEEIRGPESLVEFAAAVRGEEAWLQAVLLTAMLTNRPMANKCAALHLISAQPITDIWSRDSVKTTSASGLFALYMG